MAIKFVKNGKKTKIIDGAKYDANPAAYEALEGDDLKKAEKAYRDNLEILKTTKTDAQLLQEAKKKAKVIEGGE